MESAQVDPQAWDRVASLAIQILQIPPGGLYDLEKLQKQASDALSALLKLSMDGVPK